MPSEKYRENGGANSSYVLLSCMFPQFWVQMSPVFVTISAIFKIKPKIYCKHWHSNDCISDCTTYQALA